MFKLVALLLVREGPSVSANSATLSTVIVNCSNVISQSTLVDAVHLRVRERMSMGGESKIRSAVRAPCLLGVSSRWRQQVADREALWDMADKLTRGEMCASSD
jgi:hypothetical protein